jgi:hypothetical protein
MPVNAESHAIASAESAPLSQPRASPWVTVADEIFKG